MNHSPPCFRLRKPARLAARARCWLVLAGALLAFGAPSHAEAPDRGSAPAASGMRDVDRAQPMIDLLAVMSGKCPTLRISGRDYACKAVAYAHTERGRTNFTVALDDPADDGHIVSFSGQNGKRFDDNSYELPVDRMLLNSQHRPKSHGLPVPAEEPSNGFCRQLGNFAAHKVSSINCTATDGRGQRYELMFESDGKPISIRRVRQSAGSIDSPFR